MIDDLVLTVSIAEDCSDLLDEHRARSKNFRVDSGRIGASVDLYNFKRRQGR
jgi:hypothetical protein